MINKDSKKYIAQVVFVVGYNKDTTIRKKIFDIEDSLKDLIGGSVAQSNPIPDDTHPPVPRVIIDNGKGLSVNFSQVAAHMVINIDNSSAKAMSIIKQSIYKKVHTFYASIKKVIGKENLKDIGTVISIRYPIEPFGSNFPDVARFVHDRFFKVSSLGASATAGFNLGYKDDDNFFITLTIDMYQMATGDVQNLPMGVMIDINTLPVSESGIELKIDVNNKPLLGGSAIIDDIDKVELDKVFDFIENKLDTFMGI